MEELGVQGFPAALQPKTQSVMVQGIEKGGIIFLFPRFLAAFFYSVVVSGIAPNCFIKPSVSASCQNSTI